MFAFILSVIALIVGYLVYGKFVEKVFGPNDANPTPAERLADGVDYVPMSLKKTFLLHFLSCVLQVLQQSLHLFSMTSFLLDSHELLLQKYNQTQSK